MAVILLAALIAVRQADLPRGAGEVRAALDGLGPWAAAALLGTFVLRPLLLLPITPLWIAAGALLGWVEGTAFALAGTSLGAALGFAVARTFGRGWVEERLGSRLPRWTRMSDGEGLRTVLALQLTPVMPHDLINAMAGVSRMPYRAFALGSLLGTLPIIGVYAYVGQAVWSIPSSEFWAAMAILTTMTLLMLAWNRRQARRRAASLSARWEPIPEVEP
ncbi:MAG: VTT domain-containing protein [Gemmatimonadetes bacterium]|nr:VTT domain-containing protein [Gemmatimonadota bacterium]